VRLEDVTSRKEDLAKRIPPIKERNPDFNLKSSMVGANSQQQQLPPVANSLPPSATSKSYALQKGGGVIAIIREELGTGVEDGVPTRVGYARAAFERIDRHGGGRESGTERHEWDFDR